MKRVFRFFLALSLGLAVFTTAAEEVAGLYETLVPVSGQSAAERQRALSRGLEKVLVKVSGYGRIGIDPAVADALANADGYVQQFGYRQGSRTPGGEEPPQLYLHVSFQPTTIRQLLRDNDLPVWGALRPQTLAWIAVEEAGERRLLAANQEHNAPERALVEQAVTRGLPLRLPLMDLMDQRRIGVVDVWGAFRDTIIEASRRYETEAVLVGRVYSERGGQWHAQWTLYSGDKVHRWESFEPALGAAIGTGVDGTADALALQYAQVGPEALRDDIVLHVSGVTTLGHYARVTKYLESISGVRAVWPLEVGGEAVSYRIFLESPVHTMVQSISLGNVLASERRPAAGDEQENELNYRFLP